MKKIYISVLCLLIGICSATAQVGIGTTSPDSNAVLDVTSTTQGVAFPRISSLASIANPATGLVVFDTTNDCLAVNVGTPAVPIWNCLDGFGTITALTCASATPTGTLTDGVAASGVSSSVPYTGGDGGPHTGQTVTSTGVTGLTATLTAGTFATGAGSVVYAITGTPSAVGTASFALSIGGQSCTLTVTVVAAPCVSVVATVVDVVGGAGETWMDRNLGASQAATSITDAASYGDLYQWGRATDGHQCRTSGTTTTLATTTTPVHDDFIINASDWLSPQDDTLWQGVAGTNNPCPTGYRLPTETEFEDERLAFSTNDNAGAFASPLAISAAGYKSFSIGSLNTSSTDANLWTSTISGAFAKYLSTDPTSGSVGTLSRGNAFSVRCIKQPVVTATYTIGTGGPCVATVNGDYIVSTALDGTNTIDLTATVTTIGAWSITTNTVNGYSFSGSGTFTVTGTQIVTLTGTGTPTACSSDSFTITADPGSGTCSATVTAGLKPLSDWADRNLGATQVATSSTDAASYGDLYQWGRAADGHESRTSGTTTTLATSSAPGHADFIIPGSAPRDWLDTPNDALWQGVSGVNNPCPAAYRLPTVPEYQCAFLGFPSANIAGAFTNLGVSLAGSRFSTGGLNNVSVASQSWTSTTYVDLCGCYVHKCVGC